MASNNGEPIRVATVNRGGQWYVSLFYTIADNAVHAEGLPNPTQADIIEAGGLGNPEEAVRCDDRAGHQGRRLRASSPCCRRTR